MNTRKATIWYLFFVIFVAILALIPAAVSAETLPFPYWGKNPDLLPCTGTNCVSSCQLIQLLHRLIWFGVTLVVFALAPAFIAFGGIMIMIARGSPENLGKGKRIITSAVVGLVIAAGAFVIVNTFFILVVKPLGGTSSWTTINCPVPPAG